MCKDFIYPAHLLSSESCFIRMACLVVSVCLSVSTITFERVNFFEFCFLQTTYDLPTQIKFVN